jgi:hypothetical protein
MTTAIICTAILAAMLFLLGLNVSRMRGVTAKAGGSQFPSVTAGSLAGALIAAARGAPGPRAIALAAAIMAGSMAVAAIIITTVNRHADPGGRSPRSARPLPRPSSHQALKDPTGPKTARRTAFACNAL